MSIISPERALARLIDRLPQGLRGTAWNIVNGLSWITLPAWFVSQLADIRLVASWGNWLLSRDWAPQQLLHAIALVAHAVSIAWHYLVTPIHQLMTWLLPWDFSIELTGTIVAVIPAATSFLRWQYNHWRARRILLWLLENKLVKEDRRTLRISIVMPHTDQTPSLFGTLREAINMRDRYEHVADSGSFVTQFACLLVCYTLGLRHIDYLMFGNAS